MMMFTYRTRFQKIGKNTSTEKIESQLFKRYLCGQIRYYLDKVLNYPHEIGMCCDNIF